MRTIYVADGNAADREHVFDALRDDRHDVMCFSDPCVALRSCATDPPCLLITEAVFADMTGFWLIREMRKLVPDVPVLVLTDAYTREAVEALTSDAGSASYLAKPASMSTIRAAADVALLARAWLAAGGSPDDAATLEDLAGPTDGERTRQWRLDVLVRAGYPQVFAELIARQLHADLHVAVDLVRRGCGPELATRILV
jgi:DNA-binding response OmpR family regulator